MQSQTNRSKELLKLSEKFLAGGYQITAGWIKKLSQEVLSSKTTVDEALKDWNDVRQTFRNEFMGSDANWQ
jgi:hypothetical protein